MWRRSSSEQPAPAGPGVALLELSDLTVAYGAIVGVRDLNLRVQEGEIVALLGANGAGKSSTLRGISGLASPRHGSVRFAGADITSLPAEQRVRRGISLTPEGRRVFPSLTVAENLRMGALTRSGPASAETLERVLDWFGVLKSRYTQRAGSLSGGEQQQLAIGRSLMSSPRLLLLDEPSLGLAPKVVDLIFDIVTQLREEGLTLLIVEQNVDRTLEVADRAYVLSSGTLQIEGSARELRASSGIERAYLGIGVSE